MPDPSRHPFLTQNTVYHAEHHGISVQKQPVFRPAANSGARRNPELRQCVSGDNGCQRLAEIPAFFPQRQYPSVGRQFGVFHCGLFRHHAGRMHLRTDRSQGRPPFSGAGDSTVPACLWIHTPQICRCGCCAEYRDMLRSVHPSALHGFRPECTGGYDGRGYRGHYLHIRIDRHPTGSHAQPWQYPRQYR